MKRANLKAIQNSPRFVQIGRGAWPNKEQVMPRAMWKDTVLAETPAERVQIVEGNVYFPPDAVHRQYLRASDTHTVCPWKGSASYYDVLVDGEVNRDAAWYYPQPKDAAKAIAGYVAFWRGVLVER